MPKINNEIYAKVVLEEGTSEEYELIIPISVQEFMILQNKIKGKDMRIKEVVTNCYISTQKLLKKEEKTVVFDYFFALGKGNAISQSAYFNGMKATLKTLTEGAEKENKRYGDLFIKLGFLCGLLILILIV